jgi:hypothetical protein
MTKVGQYFLNYAILLDQAVNTVFGGSPNETISERSAKAQKAGRLWGCVLCKFLGWCATKILGKPTDHCAQALTSTIGDDAVIPDGK